MPELPEGVEREPQQTAAFWRALQRAAMHVQSSGKELIDGGNLLVAFYRERDSHAVCLLEQQGVHRLDVLNYISHGITKKDREDATLARREVDRRRRRRGRGAAATRSRARRPDDPLAAYTVNFVEKAAAGRDRSADRPRRRARAHDPGAGAAPQEQPDLRRRAGRRQDRHRRGPGAGASSRGKVPSSAAGRTSSTRSTWARCSPAPSSAASSRSASRASSRRIAEDSRTRSCSSTRSTPSSAPARPAAARWTRRTSSSRRWRRASCAASARRPSRSTSVASSATARWRAASRRSRCASRSVDETVEILQGPQDAATRSTTTSPTPTRRCEAAAKLSAQVHQRSPPARQGHRRHRRGGRRRPAAARSERKRRWATQRRSRRSSPRWRRSRRSRVSASDEERAARARAGSCKQVIFGQDRAIDALVSAIKLSRSGLARGGQADRLVPVLAARPASARPSSPSSWRKRHRRRVPALRHDRVHGEAHGVAADRRAAGLRRLRPGRPADRRRAQDAARGAWCSTRSRRRTPTSSTSCCR